MEDKELLAHLAYKARVHEVAAEVGWDRLVDGPFPTRCQRARKKFGNERFLEWWDQRWPVRLKRWLQETF